MLDVQHLCWTVQRRNSETQGKKNLCILLCHWGSLHRLSLLSTLPPSVLCHTFFSCTRSVAANATVLWWDTLQPLDGVSLCSVCVYECALGCVMCSARAVCVLGKELRYTAVDIRWCMHGSRSIFWMPAVRSRLYRLVAEGEAYLLGDVGEGWTRREWGRSVRWEGDSGRNVSMWMWEREVDAHAEGWSLASGSSLCLPFSPALPSRSFPHPFATVGKVHLQSLHHFCFLLNTNSADHADCCSCLHLYGLFRLSRQCNRGSLQTPACSLIPLWERWGGWGGFLNESRDWRVVPQHLLRRGGRAKGGRAAEELQAEGFGVDEGWRGSGWEKNGYAGSSCSGRAAALQAACHSGTALPLLDMSLAGRVSCSMLNCFVSPQAFILDVRFCLRAWFVMGVYESPPQLACLCVPAGLSEGGWGVLVDTRERCGS